MKKSRIVNCILGVVFLSLQLSCAGITKNASQLDEDAPIFPDYKEVTIPANIAPLNFSFLGEENCALLVGDKVIRSRGGLFRFGKRQWRKLLTNCSEGFLNLTVSLP